MESKYSFYCHLLEILLPGCSQECNLHFPTVFMLLLREGWLHITLTSPKPLPGGAAWGSQQPPVGSGGDGPPALGAGETGRLMRWGCTDPGEALTPSREWEGWHNMCQSSPANRKACTEQQTGTGTPMVHRARYSQEPGCCKGRGCAVQWWATH